MVMNSVDSIFFPSLFSLLTDYWGGWNGTRFSTWRGCRLLDGTPWKCTVCDVIAIDAFSFCLTYSLPLVFWSCLLMIIAFDVKTLIVVQSEPLFVCLWSLLVITFWVLPFLFVPSTLWFLLTHKFLTHVCQWELLFVAYSITDYEARTVSYLWNLNSWGHCLWWFPHLSNLSSAFPISLHTCLHFFPFFGLW